MIYINPHRNTNKYHTTDCQQVTEYHTREITDEHVIETIKANRKECKYCSGEWYENNDTADQSYHQALADANPEDIEI